jgi:hypothetical protein
MLDTLESNCWHSVIKGSVSHIICDFGYWKVCARWVSWSLTVEYRTQRNAVSFVFLSPVEAERGASLSLAVPVGETLAHRYAERQKGHPWNGPMLSRLVGGN